MRAMSVTTILIFLGVASPALAIDAGNANAEQQTKPAPNRGGTAGGPAHDPSGRGMGAEQRRQAPSDAQDHGHHGAHDKDGHAH